MAIASFQSAAYSVAPHQANIFGHSVVKDLFPPSVLLFSILLPLYPETQYQNHFSNTEAIAFHLIQMTAAKLRSEDWKFSNHKKYRYGVCLSSDLQFLVATSLPPLVLFILRNSFSLKATPFSFLDNILSVLHCCLHFVASHILFPIKVTSIHVAKSQ